MGRFDGSAALKAMVGMEVGVLAGIWIAGQMNFAVGNTSLVAALRSGEINTEVVTAVTFNSLTALAGIWLSTQVSTLSLSD